MKHSQMDLLRRRRFLPLFVTQSLGAFNDNLFKNAIVFLVTFVLAEQSGLNAPLLVAAAGGIFIFPFFLFSANAGQLADKYDKARLVRILKLTELALMIAAGVGFLVGSIWFLMLVLFLNEGVLHLRSLAKYAVAFFRISTSSLRRLFSCLREVISLWFSLLGRPV